MANVYSTPFCRAHAGVSDTYTVPPGMVAIIRCITGFNASAVAISDIQVSLVNSLCTICKASLAPQSEYRPATELRVVVEQGDKIVASPSGSADITVDGYLLALP